MSSLIYVMICDLYDASLFVCADIRSMVCFVCVSVDIGAMPIHYIIYIKNLYSIYVKSNLCVDIQSMSCIVYVLKTGL